MSRRRTTRRVVSAFAVALLVAFTAPGSAAGEAGGEFGPASLASRYSAPWLALQTEDGRFSDYVSGAADGHGRYGEAMLGYALLQTGLRDGNQAYIDAGLRAIGFALRHPERQEAERSVFEMHALAAAYNLAIGRLPGDPRVEALLPGWTQRLQAERPVWLYPGRGYWNKAIVEAAAALELLNTGIASTVPGAWLQDRAASRARVERFVNRTVPRLVPRGGGRVTLSDPPANPIAYHALSLGFYSRAVRLLGRDAERAARQVLLGAARTSLALAAPDGDLAYVGRSQEQAWALTLTAYGVEAAARHARGKEAERLRALARRALARLEAAHPVGDGGFAIVPAFAGQRQMWYGGIDQYAGAVPYAGLTIVGLGLTADLGVAGRVGPRIASDDELAVAIPAQAGDMAVVRRGAVWFAVKRRRSAPDLRSDFGLVALKSLGPAGWQDVIPSRPLSTSTTLGPTLVLDGAEHEPTGRRIEASRRRVLVTGSFRAVPGRVEFAYVPIGCGVELRFRGPPEALYRYSSFFPARGTPIADGDRSVVGAGQRVTVSAPMSLQVTGGFRSATEPELLRADLAFVAGPSGRVAIRTCAG
jgi:hypothetical protein